jgi:4-amino-4-deoxy-L-arabinose transferase-like glycosyltransferase
MTVSVADSNLLLSKLHTRRIFFWCLLLFFTAAGVRILVWQNNRSDIERVMSGVALPYQTDAKALLAGDFARFISGENPPVDASILAHPPGYPIVIAAVYSIFGENTNTFRFLQILLNSLAPILVFLIGFRLFEIRTAVIATFLVMLSPQFSYYSAIVLPDELSAVLILAALYFFVAAFRDKRLRSAMLCGASIGLSCSLRSNALLLPLFFVGVAFVVLPKQFRLKFAAAIFLSFVIVVSPITIRNCVVFHDFIPLSLGVGTTFVEGLGDYDSDAQLGMPSTDEGVMELDARMAERLDYYGNLYNPDGIEREGNRMKLGLSVVRANPRWFLTSVLHRGTMTFRMERVPVIAPQQTAASDINPFFYYLDLPLKLFQKAFITAVFIPLFFFGAIRLLGIREQRIQFAILAPVPLYYAIVQSLLHTEYRYLLPASHVLIFFAALSISAASGKVQQIIFQRSNG